jgi:hypothetical protein
MLGVAWALGAAGFPFGHEHDPDAALSALAGVRVSTGAPAIAVLGVTGAVVALVMAAPWGGRVVRAMVLGFASGIAATLLLVVPDFRVLVAVAYAPVFLVGAPFGWPPASYLEVVPWPVVNQMLCITGGLLWTATAVVYRRRSQGACVSCGRTDAGGGWTTPAAAARWGRWAVAIAVIVPCLYAATRWAWALGIPLGISEEFLREGEAEGLWVAGAALATVAVGGAILSLGLVQRWGEVFPRWLPFWGGRRVPPALAIVPASLVAVIVTEAGLMYVRLALAGHWAGEAKNWGAIAPELLWPIWGIALGLATLAYYIRRREEWAPCGRI